MVTVSKVAYFMLSGGLDSAVAGFRAVKELKPDILKAIFISRFVEGGNVHKAYRKEILYARIHAMRLLNIPEENFYEIHVPFSWYAYFKRRQPDIYPYGRNLVYIAVAASFISMDMKFINPMGKAYLVLGFNIEDGHDAKKEFLKALEKAVKLGTYQEFTSGKLIKFSHPFIGEPKSKIIEYARDNKIEWIFKESWSCYLGEEIHCGECAGCEKRKKAFKDAGVPDPTEYKFKY